MVPKDVTGRFHQIDLENCQRVITERVSGLRQNILVVAGCFGQSNNLTRLIRNNGFLIIDSKDIFTYPHFMLWPRNAFTQIGGMIITRHGVNQLLFAEILKPFIEKSGGKLDKIKFFENETIANGGNVFVSGNLLVVPTNTELILPSNYQIIEMPRPNYERFMIWLNSNRRQMFENRKQQSGADLTTLGLAYNAWALKTFAAGMPEFRADQDLFMGLAEDVSGKHILAVDEIYAELFPKEIEAARNKLEVILINCVEAAFLGSNFWQGADIALVTREAPAVKNWLATKVLGKDHVIDFPVNWVRDEYYGCGFHCLFNTIDLSAFK